MCQTFSVDDRLECRQACQHLYFFTTEPCCCNNCTVRFGIVFLKQTRPSPKSMLSMWQHMLLQSQFISLRIYGAFPNVRGKLHAMCTPFTITDAGFLTVHWWQAGCYPHPFFPKRISNFDLPVFHFTSVHFKQAQVQRRRRFWIRFPFFHEFQLAFMDAAMKCVHCVHWYQIEGFTLRAIFSNTNEKALDTVTLNITWDHPYCSNLTCSITVIKNQYIMAKCCI